MRLASVHATGVETTLPALGYRGAAPKTHLGPNGVLFLAVNQKGYSLLVQ